MTFKMKGTPMLRNFGVSPLREEESIVNQTRVKADTGLVNTANAGNTTVAAIEYKAPDQTIENLKEKEGPECNEECQERKRLKKEERRKNRENRKKARANRRSQRRNR